MNDESGLVRLIEEFAHRYGIGSALLAGLFFLIIWRFDLVRKIFADRSTAVRAERAEAWNDMQDLLRNMQDLLAAERAQNARLVKIIESSEAGNARLRHFLNNVLTWASSLTFKLKRENISFEPLDLAELMERDADYARRLRDILGQGDSET